MKKDKDIYEENYGCVPIGACALVFFLIFVLLTFCSCRPTKEIQVERVEVPVVVTQEHTIEHTKIDHVRDTLRQRDSVFYYVNGDTVRIEKWHYLQGTTNVVKLDTLHVYDSIPYPVEVVKERTTVKTETVNVLHWWQKCLMWAGGIFLLLIGAWAFFTVRKIRK